MSDLLKKYKIKNKDNCNENTTELEVEITNEEIKKEIIEKERYKNRIKMAWVSMFFIIVIVLYTFFNPDITDNQVRVLETFGFVFATIVVSYYTGNAVSDFKMKKSS